jgi:hypothetical protein
MLFPAHSISAGSSGQLTIGGAGAGGLVTGSFPYADNYDAVQAAHFGASARQRERNLPHHRTVACGHYCVYDGSDGKRLIPFLVPTAGALNDIAGNKEDVVLGTITNKATASQLSMVTLAEHQGTTVHIVTAAFAEPLPDEWPKGTAFKSDATLNADIVKVLTAGETYHIVFCPNTFPIRPGEESVLLGKPGEPIRDEIEKTGKFGGPWFHLVTQTAGSESISYSAELQRLILAEKAALGPMFPKGGKFKFVESTELNIKGIPMLMGDDNPITQAEAAIRGALEECVECNMKTSTPQGSNISMNEPQPVSAMKEPANTGDKERLEAKHRLSTCIYKSNGELELLPLRDQMTRICHDNKKTQSERMINVLNETAVSLNKSTDVINRMAALPKSYKLGPFGSLLVLSQYSEEPIQSLEKVAREGACGKITTAHFIPHTYEIKNLSSKMEEQSQTQNLQSAVGETQMHMKQANIKMLISTTIRDEHDIVTLCSNITVRCLAKVQFDPNSIDRDAVPWEHYMARSIGLAVTDANYIAFKEDRVCNAKLNYFVFGIIDRCIAMTRNLLTDESAIEAAMVANGNNKADKISPGI